MKLRCVCGAEVENVDDLTFVKDGEGVVKARCRNEFCRLEEVFSLKLSDKRAEIRFSKMFSTYNLLFMGSDLLEKRLELLSRRVLEVVTHGKSLKTRITYGWR
ncbi:MAG: hypothetical protein QXX49_05910 [Candidatus Caldarchaeum sp.]